MTLVSQAEYARRLGVTRASISQWEKAGKLILEGEQVDVEATDARLKRYRRDGLLDIDPHRPVLKLGRPGVKQTNQLNSDAVFLTCTDALERLERLGWKKTFDWSVEAQEECAQQAAVFVGWEAVKSDLRDDGHWSGFQLRILKEGRGKRLYRERHRRRLRVRNDRMGRA